MSIAEHEFIESHVRGLWEKGLVNPCLGPYASPILVVKKPNSSDLRCMCHRLPQTKRSNGSRRIPPTQRTRTPRETKKR